MYFLQDGIKYIFNENESRESIRAAAKHLEKIQKYFEEKDMTTNYIIYLLAMKSVCEMQLKEIGDDGIRSVFYRRMRIEKETNDHSA